MLQLICYESITNEMPMQNYVLKLYIVDGVVDIIDHNYK